MGYYRKGHFKKNGKRVNGHYVNTFGRGKEELKIRRDVWLSF